MPCHQRSRCGKRSGDLTQAEDATPERGEKKKKNLLVCLSEKERGSDSISEAMMCEKPGNYTVINYKKISTSAISDELKASAGWFAESAREVACSVKRHGESSLF